MPTTSTTSERSCLTLPAASNRAATGSRTKLIGVRPEPIMLTAATPKATMPARRMSAEVAERHHVQPAAREQGWESQNQTGVGARTEEDLRPEAGSGHEDDAHDSNPSREHDQARGDEARGLARLVGLRVGDVASDAE